MRLWAPSRMQSTASSKLELVSNCLTRLGDLLRRREIGELRAMEGWERLSSLQREQRMSTMEILPTHREISPAAAVTDQTEREGSPAERRRRERASATVEDAGSGLSGGLPRQRSDIS
uniref:Uncharacterized protein n=1 Tax=Opuntia streptacantha TaxID=393608 RepID=A0A7C9CVZ3_OPUST